MCGCIATINESLKEQYEDQEASIDVGFSFGGNSLSMKPSGLAMQYRKKLKDGSFAEKRTTVNISPTFCPFCGKEYKEAAK